MRVFGTLQVYCSIALACCLSACTGTAASGFSVANADDLPILHDSVRSISAKTSDNLMYVSDAQSSVYVFSYPQGKLLQTISGLKFPLGECVDAAGNVWVTVSGSNEIVEYSHGGSEPIATLSDPGSPIGCAIDPVTGNLAVTNYYPASIEIFKQAQGTPTSYSSSDFGNYYFCTYDSSGDLFADGDRTGAIAELPYGGYTLQPITLSKDLEPLSIQWDGSDISIVGQLHGSAHPNNGGKSGPTHLYRVAISGPTGTVISQTDLESPHGKHVNALVQYWIHGKSIIGPGAYFRGKEGLFTWRYPKGGRATRELPLHWHPWGTALSSR